jgi:hypothetical protein
VVFYRKASEQDPSVPARVKQRHSYRSFHGITWTSVITAAGQPGPPSPHSAFDDHEHDHNHDYG